MKNVFAVVAACALFCLGSLAQADVFNLGAGFTNLETVAVGDAGNAGELSGPGAGSINVSARICGAVGYNYNIGKYEVTAGQYRAFLNAVAATDTYGLYNATMSQTDYGCGITRNGISGSYTYSVASGFVNRPVNYVSYWDACRFANWLGNGQGNGDTETGAYTLGGYNGADGRTILRNAGATWAVTSEDEWYKAAYYKGGGTNAGYWDYPTSSDTDPGRDMADVSGNNANHSTGSGAYPIDSGKFTTVVGQFQNSESPYGTFDQGGNVWELNEAIVSGNAYSVWRGLRGGAFDYGGRDNLKASGRYSGTPTGESSTVGFRLVQFVPEPSSLIALLAGLAGLLGIRRRRA